MLTIDSKSDTDLVLEWVKENHPMIANAGGTIERVGNWVWIEFPDKPAPEVRKALSLAGFRWINIRGKWAHACGHFTRRGKGDPKDKYEWEVV